MSKIKYGSQTYPWQMNIEKFRGQVPHMLDEYYKDWQRLKDLSQMQELKQKIDRGDIGQIKKIFAETQPWMAQLGTHYIDYMIWANGGYRAKSVIGHVHGPETLKDNHPSPDFLFGEVLFENGTRGYIECGYFSERHNPEIYMDSRSNLPERTG